MARMRSRNYNGVALPGAEQIGCISVAWYGERFPSRRVDITDGRQLGVVYLYGCEGPCVLSADRAEADESHAHRVHGRHATDVRVAGLGLGMALGMALALVACASSGTDQAAPATSTTTTEPPLDPPVAIVVELQEALRDLGLYDARIDGVYGSHVRRGRGIPGRRWPRPGWNCRTGDDACAKRCAARDERGVRLVASANSRSTVFLRRIDRRGSRTVDPGRAAPFSAGRRCGRRWPARAGNGQCAGRGILDQDSRVCCA